MAPSSPLAFARSGTTPCRGSAARTLLRRSIGLGFALWLTEVGAGSIGFLWNAVGGKRAKVPNVA